MLPVNLKKFARCLKAFKVLRDKAFGMEIDPDYLKYIKKFEVKLIIIRPAVRSPQKASRPNQAHIVMIRNWSRLRIVPMRAYFAVT